MTFQKIEFFFDIVENFEILFFCLFFYLFFQVQAFQRNIRFCQGEFFWVPFVAGSPKDMILLKKKSSGLKNEFFDLCDFFCENDGFFESHFLGASKLGVFSIFAQSYLRTVESSNPLPAALSNLRWGNQNGVVTGRFASMSRRYDLANFGKKHFNVLEKYS